MPGFVLGFLAMAAARSLGDYTLAETGAAFGALGATEWHAGISLLSSTVGSKLCLGTAMAAVGLSTGAASLRGVGVRPFALGMSGSLLVGACGVGAATAVGHFAV